MLRVGLTGGIASGKSHVRRRLEAAGCTSLDLDHLTHELLASGAAGAQAVEQEFGPGLLAPDGAVDRRALGALVFADEHARARLNARLHPLVRAEERRRSTQLEQAGCRVAVSEAAVVIEAGAHLRYDRMVVAHCDRQQQLERLVRRDGLTLSAAEARLRAQMPAERKRLFGHWVVDTAGDVEQTDEQADGVAAALLAEAALPRRPGSVDEAALLGCLQRGTAQGPRGLAPLLLVAELAGGRGLELQSLAARLEPPLAGPWYLGPQAESGAAGPGAAAVMPPLAMWSLASRGSDAAFLALAAASLAWLLAGRPGDVAACVLAAGVAFELAAARVGGTGTGAAQARRAEWEVRARHFAGTSPPAGGYARLWVSAQQALESGERGSLAGALAGIVAGPLPGPLEPALVDAVRTCLRTATSSGVS